LFAGNIGGRLLFEPKSAEDRQRAEALFLLLDEREREQYRR